MFDSFSKTVFASAIGGPKFLENGNSYNMGEFSPDKMGILGRP